MMCCSSMCALSAPFHSTPYRVSLQCISYKYHVHTGIIGSDRINRLAFGARFQMTALRSPHEYEYNIVASILLCTEYSMQQYDTSMIQYGSNDTLFIKHIIGYTDMIPAIIRL